MINTKIAWTKHTWNPWVGCRKVSAGCENCYMFREQRRFGNDPTVVRKTSTKSFNAPLSKKMRENPGTVFTCSWSDFFIEEADAWRDEAWDIILRTPEHMYLVLTKRPERISTCLPGEIYRNVALGITAENQSMLDERMETLFHTLWAQYSGGACFVSIEPMLEEINIREWEPYLDWVIVGGESGPNARPIEAEWVRDIRDRCLASETPFFFKQWSAPEWGRVLDGKYWDEFPEWGRPNR